MKEVKIYTTQSCPHCRRAKTLLANKKIAFREVDLTNDSKKRQELEEKTGWMTVPMIFIGDKLIGGADELYALDASGKLDSMLEAGHGR